MFVSFGLRASLRKRRRQLWHSKAEARAKKRKGKYAGRKWRATMDQGKWDKELPPMRKMISIYDKIQAINFYNDLRKKKVAEALKKCEPSESIVLFDSGTRSIKKKVQPNKDQKGKDKKRVEVNLERETMQQFPEICKHMSVYKWIKACEREKWRQLPEIVQRKNCTVPNFWRQKVGAPLKARSEGGQVPLVLLQELDRLVMESASGTSEISETKEVVTAENIVLWLHPSSFPLG